MLRREMLKLFGLIPFLGLGANKSQEQESESVQNSFINTWKLSSDHDKITYTIYMKEIPKLFPLQSLLTSYTTYDDKFLGHPFKKVVDRTWRYSNFCWTREDKNFKFILTINFEYTSPFKSVFPGVGIPTISPVYTSFDKLIKEIESNV